MSSSINSATLLGNVGRDPEVRTVGNGKVASFSIATSESWTKNGERQEKTQWHNIVVWGKLADVVQSYVHKGSKVLVIGSIENRKWEKDGVERTSTEIVLRGFSDRLVLLDKREGGSGETFQRSSGQSAQSVMDEEENSIPFASSAGIW